MTLNALDLEYAHRKLRTILKSVLDTIHVDLLTFSIPNGSSAPQSQTLQIVKHFEFDLTCDVISDPEVNNIMFPSTKSLYRTPFELCKSDQQFLSSEEGGGE